MKQGCRTNFVVIAMNIMVITLAMLRFHHHDCNGDLFFRLSSGIEIELSGNSRLSVPAADDNHLMSHGHTHHSHPCDDKCALNQDYSYLVEDNRLDYSALALQLHLAAILTPVDCDFQPQYFDPEFNCVTYNRPVFYTPRAINLRAPPVC